MPPGGGDYISVFGAIFTLKSVQRLPDIKWAGEATTHEVDRAYDLARVLASFRLATTALGNYYDKVSKDPTIPPLIDRQPHPRFFPYLTGFIEYDPEA